MSKIDTNFIIRKLGINDNNPALLTCKRNLIIERREIKDELRLDLDTAQVTQVEQVTPTRLLINQVKYLIILLTATPFNLPSTILT